MVTIIFESHGTTYDNEIQLSSGWYDAELSALGIKQAKELGARYQSEKFDAIFCSGLQRSCRTAEIAFGGKGMPIMKDTRLKECDYGSLTRHPSNEVESLKKIYIANPFPNGESYQQTTKRMGDFLKTLLADYDGKRVMIIGHRATQYGLEHWIKKIPLEDVVVAPWKWQSGWIYHLEKLF